MISFLFFLYLWINARWTHYENYVKEKEWQQCKRFISKSHDCVHTYIKTNWTVDRNSIVFKVKIKAAQITFWFDVVCMQWRQSNHQCKKINQKPLRVTIEFDLSLYLFSHQIYFKVKRHLIMCNKIGDSVRDIKFMHTENYVIKWLFL